MLTLVIFSGFMMVITMALAAAILARHRAGAAADLAALAAAGEPAGSGATDAAGACGRARRIAAANAARLEQCRSLPDGSVLVRVALSGRGLDLLGPAHATARAGVGSQIENGAGPG